MASGSSVIDLTAESPPARSAGLRRSSSEAGQRLRRRPSIDALLTIGEARQAGPSRPAEARHQRWPSQQPQQTSARREARPAPTSAGAEAGGDGNSGAVDDDDDDDGISFVGMTEAPRPRRRPNNDTSWHRALRGLAEGNDADDPFAPTNINIHEGLPRGPHGRNTRDRAGPGPPYNPGAVNHLAFPPLAGNPFQVRHLPHEAWTRTSMILDAMLMHVPMMRRPAPAVKLPEEFDKSWTHPIPSRPGFSDDFIEPPVDLDTYFDDKAVVTGPLPDTTPICAGCRHALVLGGAGDKRIWVMPCGHVIDGRCLARLSGLPTAADKEREAAAAAAESAAAPASTVASSQSKGKGKAVEPAEQRQPSSVGPIRNTRSTRAAAARTAPTARPAKPKRFKCPVDGCGQSCNMERGHKTSCIEAFM